MIAGAQFVHGKTAIRGLTIDRKRPVFTVCSLVRHAIDRSQKCRLAGSLLIHGKLRRTSEQIGDGHARMPNYIGYFFRASLAKIYGERYIFASVPIDSV